MQLRTADRVPGMSRRCAFRAYAGLRSAGVLLAMAPLAAGQIPSDAGTDDLAARFGFGPMQIYKIDRSISNLRLVDLDGDARTDAILWNSSKNRFELFRQPRAGEAEPRPNLERNEVANRGPLRNETIPVTHRVAALDVGDFTGDGRSDIVFFGEPREVVILPGEGEGRFGPPQSVRAAEGEPRSGCLASADFDGDGKTDVVVLGNEQLLIFSQKPGGGLARPTRLFHNIKGPTLILAGDLNGDGRSDLIIGSSDKEYGVHVVLQGADGGLGAIQPVRIADQRSLTVARRKQGGDELLAIESATGRLVVYRWELPVGATAWPQAIYSYPVQSKSKQRPLAVADVTGDGHDDVVAVDPESAQLLLFASTPAGFASGAAFPGLVKTTDVQIGDVDGDGRNEVLSVSREEKIIGVSRYAEGRLAFPTPLKISGTPLAVTTCSLKAGEPARRIAYLALDRPPGGESGDKAKDAPLVRVVTPDSGEVVTTIALRALDDDLGGIRIADVNQDGLNDLLVFVRFQAPQCYLQQADGSFAELSGAAARDGLVKENAIDDFTFADVTGDGRPEVLLTQKNLVRALVVKDGQWTVVDQCNPEASDSQLKGLAVLAARQAGGAPTIVTYDRKTRDLLAFERREDRTFAISRTTPIGGIDATQLAVLNRAGGAPQLIASDVQKFALLQPGAQGPSLVEVLAYESKLKDAWLADSVAGDLNHDGVPDIVLVDTRKANLEVLSSTDKGDLLRALTFQVFQGKRFSDEPSYGGEPREVLAGDVTGDGIDDIVLLVHDRLIVYPGT